LPSAEASGLIKAAHPQADAAGMFRFAGRRYALAFSISAFTRPQNF
jgi:hypothetical protein